MNIQATISKLQSDIKRNGNYIEWLERRKKESLSFAKEMSEDVYFWRKYHAWKEDLSYHVKQQKINKSLYKLMCEIRNQMPYDSVIIITTNEIREM